MIVAVALVLMIAVVITAKLILDNAVSERKSTENWLDARINRLAGITTEQVDEDTTKVKDAGGGG